MRRLICVLLTLLLALGAAAVGSAEGTYKLGDVMDDFEVTLSDGAAVSLYGLLAEKKAVLVNFWASWCSPCRREFPFMQQAYDDMSDEIGIIAVSCEPTDTDEKVLALKDELGLTTLPMGLDNGQAARFALQGYPTSVLVDRNGVICFMEAGTIPDKNKFIRLFSAFTGDDYSEPLLLTAIPDASYTGEYPSDESLKLALGAAEGIEATAADGEWPFTPSEDGSCVEATNGEIKDTTASLKMTVNAQAGEGLGYEYTVSSMLGVDSFIVSVDGELVKYYGGEEDWQKDYIAFGEAGDHEVDIAFKSAMGSSVANAYAAIRGVSVLSADEVSALNAQKPVGPKTLEGGECSIEPANGDYKTVVIRQYSEQTAEETAEYTLVSGDSVKLKIKIGADVNENFACVADNKSGVMLSKLPFDGEGYIYDAPIVSMANGNEYPYNNFSVFTNITDIANGNAASFACFASEADVDAFLDMMLQFVESYGVEGIEMSWEYADGSPKLAAEPQPEAEPQLNADGTADYIVEVVDVEGAPVTGAMIQICTPETCTVAQTDAEGLARHNALPYPFEIHVLMVPADYEGDAQVYTMPENGGRITITLNKK